MAQFESERWLSLSGIIINAINEFISNLNVPVITESIYKDYFKYNSTRFQSHIPTQNIEEYINLKCEIILTKKSSNNKNDLINNFLQDLLQNRSTNVRWIKNQIVERFLKDFEFFCENIAKSEMWEKSSNYDTNYTDSFECLNNFQNNIEHFTKKSENNSFTKIINNHRNNLIIKLKEVKNIKNYVISNFKRIYGLNKININSRVNELISKKILVGNIGKEQIYLTKAQIIQKWIELQDKTLHPTFIKTMHWSKNLINNVHNLMDIKDIEFCEFILHDFYPNYLLGKLNAKFDSTYASNFGLNVIANSSLFKDYNYTYFVFEDPKFKMSDFTYTNRIEDADEDNGIGIFEDNYDSKDCEWFEIFEDLMVYENVVDHIYSTIYRHEVSSDFIFPVNISHKNVFEILFSFIDQIENFKAFDSKLRQSPSSLYSPEIYQSIVDFNRFSSIEVEKYFYNLYNLLNFGIFSSSNKAVIN